MKLFKHDAEALQVLLFIMAKHYHIVKIDDTVHEVQLSSIFCIKCWKVAGALQRPKGMQVNS